MEVAGPSMRSTELLAEAETGSVQQKASTKPHSDPHQNQAEPQSHLAQGAHQLRRILRVVESRGSQSFRKCAAMKLAQVLLSSVSEDSYWLPLGPPPASWLTREGAAASKDALYPTVKPPQRYSTYCCFCPQDVVEEAVLLLLITESMTSGEAVISRLPDQNMARLASLQDATSIYDLLTMVMARRGQYALLSECLQRAMKFSVYDFHLWQQLGLSLMAAGKLPEFAFHHLPLQSAFPSSWKEQNPQPSNSHTDYLNCGERSTVAHAMMQAEQTACIAHRFAMVSAVVQDLSRSAAEKSGLAFREMLSAGIATLFEVAAICKFQEAEVLSHTVVSMGEEAREFLPRTYLALGLSFSLQASEAQIKSHIEHLHSTKLFVFFRAHSLDPHDAQVCMYLALQLALVRQVSAAMEPLQAALTLQADDLHSLHLLTLLLSAQKHHHHALDTLSLALSQHPDNFNLLLTKVKLEEVLFGPAAALQICEEMLQHWQMSYDFSRSSETDDSSSLAVAEKSDVSPLVRKPSIHLTLPDFQDASTGSLTPPSMAASRLEAALSEVSDISSTHRQGPAYIWTTLEHIWLQGRLLVKRGRVHLGEKVLRDAVQIHSTSHEAWSGLGEVLQALRCSQAPDCFLTALELEASCPVRTFTVIPREL
ncbi:tetratricopeptide repeat protein 7A [Nematolebias whitei]|uniref:tetratricopeptide repeat protein 7A n=1 Tax=Nematolebias whitei TaxID=451745 RepID=UPI0018974394|nr:tetratricopeptide repeat protein 7A [Nematolebias whitei]